MSNRQARREQSRRSRGDRSRPSTRRSSPGSTRGGGGGGAGEFLSGRFVLVAMVVVAILVVAIGVIATITAGGDDSGDLARLLRESEADFPADMADGYYLGSADAPLTITQYEDFRCPHCLNYTAVNEPSIISEYVASGQVRLHFQNMAILGPESVAAGKAAECAMEQDMFWELHHELFLHQAEEGSSQGTFSDSVLRGLASDVGLDMDAYDSCFADTDTLESVQDQVTAARSFGLTGTPGFLFNGVPLSGGAPSNFSGWQEVIDAQLEEIAEGGEPADGEGDNGDATDGDGDAEATATP